jgi:hypothetical protein
MTLSVYNGTPIAVKRTNRRKTISVRVKSGSVQVSSPKHLSDQAITEFLSERSAWIEKQLLICSKRPQATAKKFISGENFTFLGEDYSLEFVEGDCIGVSIKENRFALSINSTVPDKKLKPHIKELISNWYMDRANEHLNEKTKRFAALLSVAPKSVTVKNYKARWGSCSVNGDISYNWKLVFAPHHIIDYVVVHELCHIKEHNHSPKFWAWVESIIPDHKKRRKWLRENGGVMEFNTA